VQEMQVELCLVVAGLKDKLVLCAGLETCKTFTKFQPCIITQTKEISNVHSPATTNEDSTAENSRPAIQTAAPAARHRRSYDAAAPGPVLTPVHDALTLVY